jgi:SAM-dependent methyltransferase
MLVAEDKGDVLDILDVGGRQSPYTIGLPIRVTLLDLPRQTAVQKQLKLGLANDMLEQLKKRRSNIKEVVLEDMTQCSLPPAAFDGVVSVEVIEHVAEDGRFVEQIARVLKPGGWLCLTTPNGDYIRNEPPNYNPDHIRHYTRAELETLLAHCFSQVEVSWGIKTGKYRYRGLGGLQPKRPIHSLTTMANNVISHIESRGLAGQPRRTAHLLAVARRV